jgi:hypothetical protein
LRSRRADEQHVLLGDQGREDEVDLLVAFDQGCREFLAGGGELLPRVWSRACSDACPSFGKRGTPERCRQCPLERDAGNTPVSGGRGG